MPKKLAFDKHAADAEIKDLPIASLKRHSQNYRTHPEAQVERIAQSLQKYGQRKAVVIRADNNEIIAGHGVVLAAQSLGWETVRCDAWDVKDDAEAAAYLIDDNSLQRFAEDDEAVLAGLLLSLQETEFPPVSFDDDELQKLLAQADTPGPFEDAEPQEPPEEPVTQPGDLWVFGDGEHRLVCGDSTTVGAYDAVLQSKRAALLVTSPPYWAGKSYEREANREEVLQFISDCSSLWATSVDANGRIAVNTGISVGLRKLAGSEHPETALLLDLWIAALRESDWLMRHCRIWAKHGGLAGTAPNVDWVDMHWEFIATFYSPAGKRGQNRVGGSWAMLGVWDDIKGTRSAEGHCAAFPIEIPSRILRLYSDAGDIVLEPFSGVGTTIMACEQLSRKCAAIEISPAYCDVTCRRYIDATGKPVVLEATGERFPYDKPQKRVR